jgi:TctA family transporter
MHTGPLFEAAGVSGIGLTVASTEPAAELQPLSVTMTLYVPESAVVALVIEGFCSEELKPFGPVQLYVALATVGVDKLNV